MTVMVCPLATVTVPSMVSFLLRTVSSESETRVAPDATVTSMVALRIWMEPAAILKDAVSVPVSFFETV